MSWVDLQLHRSRSAGGELVVRFGVPLLVLGRMALERMLAGLSTRAYRHGLEPVGEQVQAKAASTSRSAVSRRFVAATEHASAELMAADLSTLDLVALMVDGCTSPNTPASSRWASASTAPSTPSRWSKAPPRTPPWCATCWSGCGRCSPIATMRCWSPLDDRFGPHGAVGIMLLATSYRVVSFGVGAVLLRWLTDRAATANAHLAADFRRTDRNRMMEVAYRFGGFAETSCPCLAALPAGGGVQRLHLVAARQEPPATMRVAAPVLCP